MGTITIDVRYLDGLAVEVSASGVTGHTVVVNDWSHPDSAVKGPAGAAVTQTTDQHGRKAKKVSVSI